MKTIADELTLFDENLKPKLFVDKITSKQGALIRTLEKYCVGYDDGMNAEKMLLLANGMLNHGKIETDHEIRQLIGKLKESETYLRIIGSRPDKTWLACNDDEVDANATNKKRFITSTKRLLSNGVPREWFYKIMNEETNKFYPVDNQIRHQINSEKKLINRYSDDLRRRRDVT